MSIDEFLRHSQLMFKVNSTFPRIFIPGRSRPMLREMKLSRKSVRELRDFFFDSDGSLRNAVRNDIDTSVKNDPRYINFRNRSCLLERRDKRWQVPLRKHGAGKYLILMGRSCQLCHYLSALFCNTLDLNRSIFFFFVYYVMPLSNTYLMQTLPHRI